MGKTKAALLALCSLTFVVEALAQEVATATPNPTVSLDEALPTQVAQPLRQTWCPSEIFCSGPVGILAVIPIPSSS